MSELNTVGVCVMCGVSESVSAMWLLKRMVRIVWMVVVVIVFFFKAEAANEVPLSLVGSEMCLRDRGWTACRNDLFFVGQLFFC